jgi:glycosyltransferase involved in cell wall biosynthesis
MDIRQGRLQEVAVIEPKPTDNSSPDHSSKVTPAHRVAVVGPFPPIRSGIAKHTEAVAKALEARPDTEVRRWGFSKQYPGWLYPGNSERDPNRPASGNGVTETLSGANPWTWHKSAREIQDWRPTTVVMPAWTFAVAPALGWIARQVSAPGVNICMIVHNAYDHEAVGWKDRLTTWQLSAADRFMTHNLALAQDVSARFPDTPVQVFTHPVFDDVPAARGDLQRRSELELLFFGLVRPYKGLDILLDAMQLLKRDGVSLTIAGEFWQDLEETKARINRLGSGNSVELISRYVDETEMAELFHRADAIVLPYRAISGSGVVALAFHYRKAVIASDLPGFAEIVLDGETGWLFRSGDAAELAGILERLDRSQTRSAGEAAGRFGQDLTWDGFVSSFIDGDEASGDVT